MKKYMVTLTAEEREHLHALIAAGKAAAQKLAHARILLKADPADGGPAWPDDGSPRPSRSAPPPSSGSASGSSSRAWRPPWSASRRTGRAGSGCSTARPRPG